MKGLIRRALRRSWRACWRGIAATAVIAKLLVPVGYMPAALAEGGFRLCDGYLPQIGARIGIAPTDTGDVPAHSMPHEMHGSMSTGDDVSGGLASGHARHDGHSQHDHWDHCPLGALATLAALAPAAWHITLFTAPGDSIATIERELFVPRTVVPFLSRAPPFVHS